MEDMMGTVLGWIGTVGTLSAYLLISRGLLKADGKRYAALNIIGGTFAALGAYAFDAWPAFASNVVWALIGLHGFVNATKRTRSERKLLINGTTVTIPEDASVFTAELDLASLSALATKPIEIVQTQPIRLPSHSELQAARTAP